MGNGLGKEQQTDAFVFLLLSLLTLLMNYCQTIIIPLLPIKYNRLILTPSTCAVDGVRYATGMAVASPLCCRHT